MISARFKQQVSLDGVQISVSGEIFFDDQKNFNIFRDSLHHVISVSEPVTLFRLTMVSNLINIFTKIWIYISNIRKKPDNFKFI